GTTAVPLEPVRRRAEVLPRLLRAGRPGRGSQDTPPADLLREFLAATIGGRELVPPRVARSLRCRPQGRGPQPRTDAQRTRPGRSPGQRECRRPGRRLPQGSYRAVRVDRA